jgi:predicted RNase H-like HicB family nuclease
MSTTSDRPDTGEPLRYAMVIEWSEDDQAYVVSFPEWDATGLYFVHTHGESYEQAVKNGQEVLADLVALAREQGKPLPAPRHYAPTTA